MNGQRLTDDVGMQTQTNAIGYDLSEFKKVDPALVSHRETRKIEANGVLRGMAILSDGRICLVGEAALVILGVDGVVQRKATLGGAGNCVTVGADGTLLVGFRDHVEVFSLELEKRATWGTLGDKAMVTSITAGSGKVFVADAGNRVVQEYTPDGTHVRSIGARDTKKGVLGFIVPSPYFDVAMSAKNELWVVNPGEHHVQKHSETGDVVTLWGFPSMVVDGFCGCCNPIHMAIFSDGWFVTAEKGIARVKVYDEAGKMVGVVAVPDSFADGTVIADLAVDEAGRVYVLDPKAGAVRIFDVKGAGTISHREGKE